LLEPLDTLKRQRPCREFDERFARPQDDEERLIIHEARHTKLNASALLAWYFSSSVEHEQLRPDNRLLCNLAHDQSVQLNSLANFDEVNSEERTNPLPYYILEDAEIIICEL
jgi:hypothetical protein